MGVSLSGVGLGVGRLVGVKSKLFPEEDKKLNNEFNSGVAGVVGPLDCIIYEPLLEIVIATLLVFPLDMLPLSEFSIVIKLLTTILLSTKIKVVVPENVVIFVSIVERDKFPLTLKFSILCTLVKFRPVN